MGEMADITLDENLGLAIFERDDNDIEWHSKKHHKKNKFVWTTRNGDKYTPDKMDTQHLINCINYCIPKSM